MKPLPAIVQLVVAWGLLGSLSSPAMAATEDTREPAEPNHGVLVGGVYRPLKYPPPEFYTVRRRGGPWPFLLTIFIGNRVGLEWNDGRNARGIEYVRGLPYVGWAMVPIFCVETFSEKSMQQVANKTGIDRRRQAKYEAHIAQLETSGQHEEAAYFRRINPFDPENRPPDSMARIPKEELDGFKGNFKAFWVEMIVGHRAALERVEGRGLRKLEKIYFLVLPKLYEAFEAMFGRSMEEIARKEGLDEVWLRKRLKEQQRAESARKESVDGSVATQPHASRLSPVGAAGVR
ncbi:MAG: hypothetical protein HYY90_02085 [Candidatus Omnitrophica bacterium]|nr:hypothetical protein [Candidatus Omnitrophota bacterium]